VYHGRPASAGGPISLAEKVRRPLDDRPLRWEARMKLLRSMGEILVWSVYAALIFACLASRNLTGLTILFACFLGYLGYVRPRFPGSSATTPALGITQQQLRNIYMLLAVRTVGPLGPLDENPGTLNGLVASDSELLARWEKHLCHHFLASGLTPERASDAVSSTMDANAKFIAALAPERIKNACNGRTYDLDEDLYDDDTCEACTKAIDEAKNRLKEVLAEEGRRKLDPWEYSIPTPPCPLPRKESL